MKSFQFHLQTVLDVRRVREDQLRGELAILHREEMQQQHRLGELRRQYVEVHGHMSQAPAPMTGAQVIANAENGEMLVLAIEDADQCLQALAERRRAKQNEALLAASDRKMLERLREQALSRYLAEHAAAVERQTDELCARPRAGN